MGRMGLALHPDKTRVVDARKERFDFLGFRVGWRRRQLMLDPVDGVMQLAVSAGNYIFADAADLFASSNPAWEYAFLESNPACSFLFRRPQVVYGVPELSTTVPPSFADVLARTTSKAIYLGNPWRGHGRSLPEY